MDNQPSVTNGHAVRGLMGELPLGGNNSVDYNFFAILCSKLGIIAKPFEKSVSLKQAIEVVDNWMEERAKEQDIIISLQKDVHDLKEENAKIKRQYSEVAGHNAEIYGEDSASVIKGLESEKKLDDVLSVLPIEPTKIVTKKGNELKKIIFHAFKSAQDRIVNQKVQEKIKELEQTVSFAQTDQIIRNGLPAKKGFFQSFLEPFETVFGKE